jgi:hypothetical protein
LKGIVIPSNWDEKGNVISLKIASSDEKEYYVESQGVSDVLLKHLREEITVSGIIEYRGAIAYIHVQDVIKQAH